MRRILASTVMAGAMLIGGAAVADATPVASVQAHATVQQAALPGHALVGANQSVVKQSASQPERRGRGRVTTRTHRRSFIGRLFGTLAFLFIGLPLLIVLALVIWFMLRRGRKQREQQMRYDQQPMNGQYTTNGQQAPYQNGRNDRF